MTVSVTEWDGTAVGPATAYRLVFPADADIGYSSDLTLQDRQDQPPVVIGQKPQARSVPFYVLRTASSPAQEQWEANVGGLFYSDASADRYLKGTHNGVTLRIGARITKIGPKPGTNGQLYEGTFVFPDPVFEADTAVSTSANPLTNSGNRPVNPTIILTPTAGNLKHVSVTVLDQTGRGVVDQPIYIPFDASGVSATTAANYLLLGEGLALPFYCKNFGLSTFAMLTRVSIPAGESVTLDCYFGSDISNTVTAQALDLMGLKFSDSQFSNTKFIYNASVFASLGTYPDVPMAWQRYTVSARSHYFTQTASNVALIYGSVNSSVADTVGLSTGVEVASVSDVNAVQQYTDPVAGTVTIPFNVTTRAPLASAYTSTSFLSGYYGPAATGPTSPLAATITPPSGSTFFGFTGITGLAYPPTLTITPSATNGRIVVNLDGGKVPLVTVGTPTSAARINSDMVNITTGDHLSFTDTLVDAGVPLTIYTAGQPRIVPTGALHTAGIAPSNRAAWFPLAVGSNTYTLPPNVTASFIFRPKTSGI